MTKQEFIEKAISNGVDNDSKNVWVEVDGYKYTTSIEDDFWDYLIKRNNRIPPLTFSRPTQFQVHGMNCMNNIAVGRE